MDFIWAGRRDEYNSLRIFTLNNQMQADTMILCAADFYRVYADGKFISYGPERTAAGYSKERTIDVSGFEQITVFVNGYNFNCYACDFQLPFFGAEFFKNGKKVYGSHDFSCSIDKGRSTKVARFSGQRACVEKYDFTKKQLVKLEVYDIEAPIVLPGNPDAADYRRLDFDFVSEKAFNGFDEVTVPSWLNRDKYKLQNVEEFDVESGFLNKVKDGYFEYDFSLSEEHSGFIALEATSEESVDVFITFEELLIDGRWVFRRSKCNDLLAITVGKGKTKFVSEEPYTMRLLKIISDKKIAVKPTLITVENKNANAVKVTGNEKIDKVIEAANNTFNQNALDIFTDCPGRERAGWLCDSLFLAQAERLFTGKNTIEKSFLENFLIANTPEVPEKMIPKCFPSEHPPAHYIPTWAMWYIIQVEDYFRRTGDNDYVKRAKKKIYDAIEFFDPYVNSDGLLENLEGWIFVEWSACNNVDYVCGVNYPVNMLFAYSLIKVAELYGDETLKFRAEKIKKTVFEQSFNEEFFIDNAIRVDGKLVRQETHLTETCQYYALCLGLCPSEQFRKKMIEGFGPLRKDAYPDVARSNMIVGNLLRFYWLNRQGESDRVIKESVEHFYSMAKVTGTLWEHNQPSASCNHGFASVAAVIILKNIIGYKTVEDGRPIFEGENKADKYGIEVTFNYQK